MERFFGRRGFSAVNFYFPDPEDFVEGDEMDSASYSSTLPSDESPVDYMPIFMSLVQVLEQFQRWRAIESFFNLLQIVLFLVLLLLTWIESRKAKTIGKHKVSIH